MEEILKYVSTYGLAVVISGVVIYYAVQFANIALERRRNETRENRHDDLVLLRTQLSSTIQTMIDRAVIRTRASRVYVFEFHNGSVGMGGLPFAKMTNTYEALGEKVKSGVKQRANMPMQLYSTFVDAVFAEDCVLMNVNNRVNELSQFVYESLVELDVEIAVRAKIVDINKQVIGFLGIDYCQNNSPDDVSLQESVNLVQDLGAEIGALLSVKKQRKGSEKST